jgi:hypothetical protein
MSESVSKRMEDQANLLKYLERIQQNYDKVGPDASGPVDSRLAGLRQKTIGGLSSEEDQLRRDVGDFQDRILRERSGAAINESEAERIKNFALDLNTSDSTFKNNLAGVIAAMKEVQAQTNTQSARRGMIPEGGNGQMFTGGSNLIEAEMRRRGLLR